MRFTTDDKTIEEEILLFMIANSQSVGGFREIAPHGHQFPMVLI